VVHEPYAGSAGWDGLLAAEDASPEDTARRRYLNMELTNADYLNVTGMPLLAGRWLAETDREDTPRVIVLSERAALTLFPGEAAVGRRVRLWGQERATVVGLVADTRFREFLEPRPTVYFPHRQFDAAVTFLAVRTAGDASVAASLVRQAMAEIDPAVLVHGHGTMRTSTAAQVARPRIVAAVLGAYAVVVVVLAMTGLYAVVAGSVVQRRREFGIRAALGATPGALLSLVLGEGFRVAALGAAVGLAATVAASSLIAAMLHGVAPTDPGTLALATVTLLGVAVVAVLVPAQRAARADPARELRAE
jgi:hypothetical protein